MNDFGILVGKYLTALPTLSTGQVSELILDSNGRLIISGRFLEDSAHVSGDAGLSVLAVRHDAESSLVDTDGDYAPLQVDATGRLKVAAVVSVEPSDAEFLEDSPHTSGDVGIHVLTVRQDVLAPSTDADGDYASFKTTADGELYVADVDARASLASIDGNISDIETELLDQGVTLDTISTELQSLTHAEDSAHSSGQVGVMPLAVRNDSLSSLVDANGDYAPIQVDSLGRVKVAASIAPIGAEAYTVTDALAAGGDGLETITAVATPWVSVATLAVGAGETAYVYGLQWAADQNCQMRLITDDTTDVIYYKTDVNSSAMPGTSEHFAESGVIEIPGAADLELRLEIKKRSATGGNCLGTGSIHVRVA